MVTNLIIPVERNGKKYEILINMNNLDENIIELENEPEETKGLHTNINTFIRKVD